LWWRERSELVGVGGREGRRGKCPVARRERERWCEKRERERERERER